MHGDSSVHSELKILFSHRSQHCHWVIMLFGHSTRAATVSHNDASYICCKTNLLLDFYCRVCSTVELIQTKKLKRWSAQPSPFNFIYTVHSTDSFRATVTYQGIHSNKSLILFLPKQSHDSYSTIFLEGVKIWGPSSSSLSVWKRVAIHAY